MKLALTATPSDAQFAPILWRGPVAEAFALARELGYDGVEIHPRYAADIDAGAMIALQEVQLGHPDARDGDDRRGRWPHALDPDPDVRRRTIARVNEHIRLAARLGSAVTIGLVRGRLGRGQTGPFGGRAWWRVSGSAAG